MNATSGQATPRVPQDDIDTMIALLFGTPDAFQKMGDRFEELNPDVKWHVECDWPHVRGGA